MGNTNGSNTEYAYKFIEELFANHNVETWSTRYLDNGTCYRELCAFEWAKMAPIVMALDDGINSPEYIAVILNKLCSYHVHELLALIGPLLRKYRYVKGGYEFTNYPACTKRPINRLQRGQQFSKYTGDAWKTAVVVMREVGLFAEFTKNAGETEEALIASIEAGAKAINTEYKKICASAETKQAFLNDFAQIFSIDYDELVDSGKEVLVRDCKVECEKTVSDILLFERSFFQKLIQDIVFE